MTRGRPGRLVIPGPAALLAVVAAAPLALDPIRSFDVPFTLAYGRFLLAHGFPSTDPFSPNATTPWFPHEWGFATLIAVADRLVGGRGPGLVGAAFLVLSLWLTWRLVRHAPAVVACAAFVLACGCQTYLWEEARAYHAGMAGFLGAFALARQWLDRPVTPWLLVPLEAVWANLHGSWPVGPVLLASVVIGDAVVRRAVGRAHLHAIGICVVATLGAMVSPQGIETVTYPLGVLFHPRNYAVSEWMPPSLDEDAVRAALALLAVTLAAAFAGRIRSWALVVPAVGLVIAATQATRFVPLAGVALAVLLTHRAEPISWAPVARIDGWLTAWISRSSGWIWPALALAAIAMLPAPKAPFLDCDTFPCESLGQLSTLPPGRVLNRYELGGAVQLVVGEAFPVFIDGRMDPYPPAIHAEYERIATLEPGWREAVEAFRPRYLLWSRERGGEALLDAIAAEPGWRLVHEEGAGALWESAEPAVK